MKKLKTSILLVTLFVNALSGQTSTKEQSILSKDDLEYLKGLTRSVWIVPGFSPDKVSLLILGVIQPEEYL
jgi:hypothetical protein